MSASQLRRFWLVLVGVICLVAAFLAGGAAKSRCAFPFCRGYKSLLTGEAPQSRRAVAVSRTDTLDTSLYEVAVERVPLPFGGWYSSIEVLGEAVILASGEGDLYRLDDEGRFTQLPLRIPLQREAVAADVGEVVNTGWFSVKDLEAVEQPSGGWRLLASHHHWNPADSCFTLRVSEIALAGDLRPTAASGAWETVFETRPCLRIKETALPFAGAEAGGRIEALSPSTVLVSVGDHQHNGIDGPDLVRDPASSYGRIYAVDLETREARLVSQGHRNPQGLTVNDRGEIWATEHGPRGGDELNRIRAGGDYGWPLVTYGTSYASRTWPLSERSGTHDGFEEPVFAWVPSIAVSQLITVRGDLFPLWAGDLLIGSLGGQTLYRVRVREGRVVVAEPIPIGERVRDLVELPAGSLALVTDEANLLLVRPLG